MVRRPARAKRARKDPLTLSEMLGRRTSPAEQRSTARIEVNAFDEITDSTTTALLAAHRVFSSGHARISRRSLDFWIEQHPGARLSLIS